MSRALRIVSDYRHDGCIPSLDAVTVQCNVDEPSAAAHAADYSDAVLLLLRSLRSAMHSPGMPAAAGPHIVQGVLAAACKTVHALSKLDGRQLSTDKRREGLRREAEIVVALLAMPSTPQTRNMTRLTAKSVLRHRGMHLVSTAPQGLCAWMAQALTSASLSADDVAITCMCLDKMARNSDAAQRVPDALANAAHTWLARPDGGAAAGDEAAVHRLIVEEFVARLARSAHPSATPTPQASPQRPVPPSDSTDDAAAAGSSDAAARAPSRDASPSSPVSDSQGSTPSAAAAASMEASGAGTPDPSELSSAAAPAMLTRAQVDARLGEAKSAWEAAAHARSAELAALRSRNRQLMADLDAAYRDVAARIAGTRSNAAEFDAANSGEAASPLKANDADRMAQLAARIAKLEARAAVQDAPHNASDDAP